MSLGCIGTRFPAATSDRADLTPNKLSVKGALTYTGLILHILVYEMSFFVLTKSKSNVWLASYIWKTWKEEIIR